MKCARLALPVDAIDGHGLGALRRLRLVREGNILCAQGDAILQGNALAFGINLSFKLHIVAGLLLLAVWPFTRLVHVLSAPVGYVTRPYVVYRSRPGTVAATPPRRGWAPVRLQGTGNQGPGDVAPAEGA